MSNQDQVLESLLEKLPNEIREEVKSRLKNAINYTPRIGIMGKSGAGKSSLINAILGKELCKTGGVGGCTREFQEERSKMGNSELVFVDLPGIAENKERDLEYKKLYLEQLQKGLDIILWVIKVDDRANQNDEEFYEWLVKHCDKNRILFVLSQCDKAEPSREWDYKTFTPSTEQLSTIVQNKQRIANDFNVPVNNVIPVACEYYEEKFNRWQVELLMQRVIECIPSNASPIFRKHIDPKNRTEEFERKAKDDWEKELDDIIDVVIDIAPIPEPIKKVAKATKNLIKKAASAVYDFFFG